MKPFDEHARLFRALINPARLEILNVLREGEACVCHLEAALGYRQAYISQHLAALRDAGIIEDRREGLNVYYRVVNPRVFSVIDAAGPSMTRTSRGNRGQGEVGIPPDARTLDNCPCPRCSSARERAA